MIEELREQIHTTDVINYTKQLEMNNMSIDELKQKWYNGEMSIEEMKRHLEKYEACYKSDELASAYEMIEDDYDETSNSSYRNNIRYGGI